MGHPSAFHFLLFLFFTLPILAAPATIPAMAAAFDLFPTVPFVYRLKIYDPSDQKITIATPDDSERTELIYRSRTRISIVSISSRSTDMIGESISSEKTANFPLIIGDCPLQFTWLLTTSDVPTAAQFRAITLTMTSPTLMRVIVTPSELYIYPMSIAGFLIEYIF